MIVSTPSWILRGRVPAAIALGVASVALQALATREALVVFAGNELVIGLVLAVWYLGLTIGALTTARSSTRRAPTLGALLLLALAVVGPACLAALRTCRLWSGVPEGELIGLGRMLGVGMLTVAPLSLLIGALFPAVCNLGAAAATAPAVPRPADAVGQVYGVEALASLAAGVLLSTLALPAIGAELCLTGAVWIAALGALAAALSGAHRRLSVAALLVLGALPVLAMAGLPQSLGERTRAQRFDGYGAAFTRLLERDTPYQNLVLAKPAVASSRGPGPIVMFAGGRYAMTLPDPYAQAPRLHLVLAQHPAPRRVLVVGGGALGALDEIYAHGVEQLDYVELDPAVIALLRQAAPAALRRQLADPRFRAIETDARRYLRETEARYHLVFIDLPDPTSAMLNRAFTRDFFEALRPRLEPGGCVVVRAAAADVHFGRAAMRPTASLHATLRAVFSHVVAMPGEETLLAAAAAPRVVSADPELLATRLRARGLQSRYFAVEELPLLLPAERTAQLDRALRGAAAPLNTDMRPVTYYYNLVLFGHYTSAALAWLLQVLLELRWWALALATLGAGLLLAALRRRRRRDAPASALAPLLAVGATGLLGSAESVALLFAFQNHFGLVYDAIALLVGLFMFGLAAGTLGASQLLARRAHRGDRLLLTSELVNLLLAALLGLTLLTLAAMPPIGAALAIGVALTLCGAGVGLAFVASAAVLRGTTGRVAGAIDAADCLGATLGALFTGVVAMPLFGVVGTVGVLCALKGASLAILLGDRSWREAQRTRRMT